MGRRFANNASPWMLGAALLLALLGSPNRAEAYTIENALDEGCHERITSEALRAVRGELATATPLALTDNEQALVDDLQFTPADDMKDLGAATLLVAVRDNDLKGRGSGDLSELAEIHGDPNAQREHCLRGANQKEPDGSQAALADCRAFILERTQQALDGLDASGVPDASKRSSVALHLSIRGSVDASLPTYYLRIGQALHAIEDSFSHAYRTADGMKITVILDWLGTVNKTHVETRDGPSHAVMLDRCNDPDPLRARRRALATEAATGVLRATLDPKSTHDQKIAGVSAILDRYLGYSPGCTAANQWCQAPENQYQTASGCACSAGGGDTGLRALALGALVAALAVARRARRRKSGRLVTSALAIACAITFTPRAADAQPDTPAPAPARTPTPEHAPPPPVTTPVKEPGPRDPSKTAFGAYGGVSGAIDKAALAGTIGARLRVTPHWTFGLDGEWNPWIALNGKPVRQGAINVYGTAILRFPLAYENFNLRTTLNLGTSYLLTNLYGAPSGSVGFYFGLSPLGLEWKASRLFFLIVNPINIAVPIPQLSGVPLLYPQYRTTLGLEFYAG